MEKGFGRRLGVFLLACVAICVALLAAYAALMISVKDEVPVFSLGMLSLLAAIFAIVHVLKHGPALRGLWLTPNSWLDKKLSRRGASSD